MKSVRITVFGSDSNYSGFQEEIARKEAQGYERDGSECFVDCLYGFDMSWYQNMVKRWY